MEKQSLIRHLARIGHQLLVLAIVAALALGATGCETARDYSLTRKLWSAGADFEGPVHHPAADPEVRLFEATAPPDILVQYSERKDNAPRSQRRAYFLLANQPLVDAGRKPRFVSPETATTLQPIPLRAATDAATNHPPTNALYATLAAGEPRLTLHGDAWEPGPYALPHYSSASATPTRVALTPLAVAGDVIMVGIAAGIIGAILWVSSGAPTGCR